MESSARRALRRPVAALMTLWGLAGAACATAPSDGEVTAEENAAALTTLPGFEALWAKVVAWGWDALFDGVWTNWYHRPKGVALVELAVMRERITRENLFNTYPEGSRTKFLPHDYVCAPETATARTIDGTCNDPRDPGMGAANVRFGRDVPMESAFPEADDRLLAPNPRTLSRELLTRDTFKPIDFLNLLAASWIQFMVHDWFSHGDNAPNDVFAIPLGSDDPLRAKFHMDTLFVPKTSPDPSRSDLDKLLPPTYLNENTHWWDGSQIYGSDLQTSRRLRAMQGGKLRIDADGRLPIGAKGYEDTGFNRNWWLGLSMMHHLFALEHNKIADMLAASHPDMTDDELYTKARMINAAQLAKIHTVEWTPAILPNETLDAAMNANWYGLLSSRNGVDRNPLKKLVPAPFGPVLFGIVANKRDLAGVPFQLTEEFVSVYRMHSLMPESIRILSHGDGALLREVPVVDTRNAGSHAITDEIGMTDLFASFGQAHPGQLVLNNYPAFLQSLSIPGFDAFDVGTVDILRDRERGVPRYNEFRRLLELKPIASFADLTDDAATADKLSRLYGGDVERLDLMIGSMAEAHRPTYFGFGETTFQIFILIASRRLHGDRFYTDLYNADVYTDEGLDWIDHSTMKSVLIRNFPELGATGLANVDNAFKPWN